MYSVSSLQMLCVLLYTLMNNCVLKSEAKKLNESAINQELKLFFVVIVSDVIKSFFLIRDE